jgi:hypothetical protein
LTTTSRRSPDSLPRLVLALGLAILAGCHDSGRREPPADGVGAVENATSTPPPSAPADSTTERAAVLLCRAYEDWPRLALDAPFADALDAELSPEVIAQLRPSAVVQRARLECPAELGMVREGTSALPAPVGRLTGFPGTFDATAPRNDSEQRLILEWTALGLGCVGLGDAGDPLRPDAEAPVLDAMGLTLDEYVARSLANADTDLSDRVFAGILACAQRRHVHVHE